MELSKNGVLEECGVEMLGTSRESIERAEDRELFKELCISLGEPVLQSEIATSIEHGLEVAEKIGYPVVLRPAFTLGGTGGGFADNEEEFKDIMKNALQDVYKRQRNCLCRRNRRRYGVLKSDCALCEFRSGLCNRRRYLSLIHILQKRILQVL